MAGKIFLIFILFITLASCGDNNKRESPPDVIDDAYRVCSTMKRTGLVSECSVKGYGRTVDIRIDTSGSEAKKICEGASEMIAKKTRNFNGEWQLRVFSPFSGDHPLAVCVLR